KVRGSWVWGRWCRAAAQRGRAARMRWMEATMFAKHAGILLASCVAVLAAGAVMAQAEPLLTQGIGTSSCSRLAGDLKPGEGLSNPVNLMAYSRAQGYISAANISLVEAD